MSNDANAVTQQTIQMQVTGHSGLIQVKVVSLSLQQFISKLQSGMLTGLQAGVYEPASNTLALAIPVEHPQ